MKSVLISIQPKWVEKIINGEKSIEVRKAMPKLKPPFTCYIYCTKNNRQDDFITKSEAFGYLRAPEYVFCNRAKEYDANGRIIGYFTCYKIEEFYCASVPYQKENNLGYGHFIDNGVYKVDGWHEGVVFERNDRYIDTMLNNNDLKKMCLSSQEIFDYIGIGKYLYAWHISNLFLYDKPKELSEFKHWVNNKDYDGWNEQRTKIIKGFVLRPLTRPPQSWCYVEDFVNVSG